MDDDRPAARDGATSADGGVLDAEGEDETGTTLGERLAREIRQGAIPREDLEVLRSQLGLDLRRYGERPEGGIEARLAHLQREVATLAAYTEEMEAFLDEQGTPAQFVEEAREDLDTVENRLDALDARATRRGDRLEDLESDVADLEGVAGRHDGQLDGLEEELTDLRGTVETFDDRLAALETTVDDLQGWRETVESVFER